MRSGNCEKIQALTSTAVLILALGLCASVSIFAFVDAALLKPLPYTDPSRLVGVFESVQMFPLSNLSYPDYVDWKARNTVLGSLDIYQRSGVLLTTPGGTVPVRGARVGGFAALALLLRAVGLYSVIAYSVSQRTREIGVRIALGAQPAAVSRLILREAGWLTAAGIVTGVACSLAIATLMRGLLFRVQSWDVPTLAAPFGQG